MYVSPVLSRADPRVRSAATDRMTYHLMHPLPASIEAHLQDAGFTGTEILVLKKLLEGGALSLRQIAAKTGKSTGVLDQAMKKLMRKGMARRDSINDGGRFALNSLQAVVEWVERDTHRKREALLRRHQNFEQFVMSMHRAASHPDIQFYEGQDGLIRAYRRLLEPRQEVLRYQPVPPNLEDDPLRDYRIEEFRERRRRGIFSRVISHDTPLGRRFQSRDPFEHRHTLLLPADEYPFTCEKAIAGDLVGCFHWAEKRACLIHYPELAQTDRVLFEGIWREQSRRQREERCPEEQVVPPKVSVSPGKSLLKRIRQALNTRGL